MTNYTTPSTTAMNVYDFHGAKLTRYIHEGRPCLIAAEVGAALGYTRVGFRSSIRAWGPELIPGVDYSVIKGDSLREFVSAGYALANDMTRTISVLYESGLHLVCIKTEKPYGRELRRYLAEHVLPVLVRGGAVHTGDALEAMEARIMARLETRFPAAADPYLRENGQWNPRNTVHTAIWALADARAELAALKVDAYCKPSFAGAQTSVLRGMRTDPDEPPVTSYLFLRSSQVGRAINVAAKLLETAKRDILRIKQTPNIDDEEEILRFVLDTH